MNCPICGNVIERYDRKFMIPIEKPDYMNIFVHKECIENMEDELSSYLSNKINYDKFRSVWFSQLSESRRKK